MDYKIKKITDDLPFYADQIMKIENVSFPSPWSVGAFEAEIKKTVSNLWAIITDQYLLGYICFWIFDTEIHIINFAIHPENRGRGFGEILLGSTIEKGIAGGLNYVWLEVRPSNVPAMALYTKLGFTEVGRRARYYNETNEDAIIMSLDLAGKLEHYRVSNLWITQNIIRR
jgi:ribosomal-protein-alanine N-acetyltransferase